MATPTGPPLEASPSGRRLAISFTEPDTVTAVSLATGRLVIQFPLLPHVAIVTAVSGPGRIFADVSIVYDKTAVPLATLSQALPRAKIPNDVVAGPVTVEKGGTLEFTVAAPGQTGMVFMNATLDYAGEQQPLDNAVAQWQYSDGSPKFSSTSACIHPDLC